MCARKLDIQLECCTPVHAVVPKVSGTLLAKQPSQFDHNGERLCIKNVGIEKRPSGCKNKVCLLL